MHIFFSGIGGAGIGPLALLAAQAGFEVSGSDKQDSAYIEHLRNQGIDRIHIGQNTREISEIHAAKPIDWFVYSAAVAIEQPNAPELTFCRNHGIRLSMRDELINLILQQKNLKLLAVAGTHGKTTTTAMLIWLFKQFGIPVSYSVGAKLSFGEMGEYHPDSEYFIYEADEFARNFLSFSPSVSVITGIDWDHPDIYPTRDSYNGAFMEFLAATQRTIMWQEDAETLDMLPSASRLILRTNEPAIDQFVQLPGRVNRLNGWEAVQTMVFALGVSVDQAITHINAFPGVSRRFEQIAPKLYSDYAHTPPKIRGAIQMATEANDGKPPVVVYEGLHNTRQHFIKEDLGTLFDDTKELYIVPSYLAREDPSLELLTPEMLVSILGDKSRAKAHPAEIDDQLKKTIDKHLADGDLVICLTAGGGKSLDEWLRANYIPKPTPPTTVATVIS